jgi:hypothetical protein
LNFDILGNGAGTKLFLGKYPGVRPDWTVVDIEGGDGIVKFDLLRKDWPWKDVSVIHCVSMLHQWKDGESLEVVKRCYEVLNLGGVLWLGGSDRPLDLSNKLMSCHKLIEEVEDVEGVTGRPAVCPIRGYNTNAIRCVK